MTTPDCAHERMTFVSADEPDHLGRRTAHLKCADCPATVDMMTTRTDAEIAAEIEAQQ